MSNNTVNSLFTYILFDRIHYNFRKCISEICIHCTRVFPHSLNFHLKGYTILEILNDYMTLFKYSTLFPRFTRKLPWTKLSSQASFCFSNFVQLWLCVKVNYLLGIQIFEKNLKFQPLLNQFKQKLCKVIFSPNQKVYWPCSLKGFYDWNNFNLCRKFGSGNHCVIV